MDRPILPHRLHRAQENGSLVIGAAAPLSGGPLIPPTSGGSATEVTGTSINAWHFGQRAFFPAAVSGTRRS